MSHSPSDPEASRILETFKVYHCVLNSNQQNPDHTVGPYFCIVYIPLFFGPGYLSQYSDSLRLDGLGFLSRWSQHFPHLPRPVLRPTQPPIQRIPFLFTEGKAAGACRWLHTSPSTEVKERVELYLYSPSGPSGSVLRYTLHLIY
jgi:hypothetical protein